MLSLETFRSRTGFAAPVSLVLVAASSVLFVLLAGRGERIAAAAGLFALAAIVLIPLTIRARRREQRQQADLDRTEARYRALLDGLPLVTWLTDPGDRTSSLYVSPAIGELTDAYVEGTYANRPPAIDPWPIWSAVRRSVVRGLFGRRLGGWFGEDTSVTLPPRGHPELLRQWGAKRRQD